jgi:hypothetical protein
MKKNNLKSMVLVASILAFASCTTLNHSMREPNTRVNLNKNDFSLSDQVAAEATSTKILGIDFARLFTKRMGNVEGGPAASISIASIPVIGNMTADKTANYSLYNLMNEHPGFDVVFYPQYETKVFKPVLGIGFLTKITTVKTTARLGKLNK